MQSFEGHSHSFALHMALSASNALRVAYFGTDVQLYLQECHGLMAISIITIAPMYMYANGPRFASHESYPHRDSTPDETPTTRTRT